MFNKYLKITFFILFMTITLSACAPNNVKEIKTKNIDNGYQFTVQDNYQSVYRKLLKQAKNCWRSYMVTAQMEVESELYPDIKTGTITSELHGALGVSIYQLIEIKAIDDTSTDVTSYYYRGKSEKLGKIIKNWALETDPSCS